MLEACRVQQPHMAADQPVELCDWEYYVSAVLFDQAERERERARETETETVLLSS